MVPTNRKLAWGPIIAAVAVHLIGLFVPIFSVDSALYAVIAKSFVTSGDWMNIYVDGTDWLDKPPFPFWIEAASMQVFGINGIAYRLPAVLLCLVGVGYTYRLARELYDRDTALLSVLILITSLNLFVSNTDVRAEAILVGLMMGGVYHFYRSVDGASLWHAIAGSLFCAAAMLTKGPFVVIFFAAPIGCYVLFKRGWRDLFSWRWILVGALVTLFVIPELVILYRQFDMHPEKVIRGETGVSGLRYFFWDTQFGRFFNSGPFRGEGSPIFFVHTLIWTFAPWAFLAYMAIGTRLNDLVRRRHAGEMMTLGGFAVIFLMFSASRFQLPYYTNVLFPLLSILTADLILTRLGACQAVKLVLRVSLGGFVVMVIPAIAFLEYLFEGSPIAGSMIAALTVGIIFVILKRYIMSLDATLIYTAAAAMILLAGYCNVVFFPRVLSYQAGYEAAKVVNSQFAGKSIVESGYDHVFEFYVSRPVQSVSSVDDLSREVVLFATQEFKDRLDAAGISYETVGTFDDFRISRPTRGFLDPTTRSSAVDHKYLILLR